MLIDLKHMNLWRWPWRNPLHPHVRKLNWVLGVIVVAMIAYYAMSRREAWSLIRAEVRSDGLKTVPVFALKQFNGEEAGTRTWRDDVIVIHFWASWCPPCIPEIPEVLAAAKKLPKDQSGRAIRWLFVSQDESWEKAHSILPESLLPENAVSVLDPDAKVSDLFGTYQFPETYLITRGGGIAMKWIGPQAWSGTWGDQALQAIESLSRLNRVEAPESP